MKKLLNLLKFGASSVVGLIQKYAVFAALIAGASIVSVMWWNSPSCGERAAMASLEIERAAREKAEILSMAHAADVIKLRDENSILKSRIKANVPDKRECDLPVSAIRLLNSARNN